MNWANCDKKLRQESFPGKSLTLLLWFRIKLDILSLIKNKLIKQQLVRNFYVQRILIAQREVPGSPHKLETTSKTWPAGHVLAFLTPRTHSKYRSQKLAFGIFPKPSGGHTNEMVTSLGFLGVVVWGAWVDVVVGGSVSGSTHSSVVDSGIVASSDVESTHSVVVGSGVQQGPVVCSVVSGAGVWKVNSQVSLFPGTHPGKVGWKMLPLGQLLTLAWPFSHTT